MKIYITGSVSPEDTDILVASTSTASNRVLVYRDESGSYWIVEDDKCFNTQPYDAEQVMNNLVSRLNTSIHKECQHR